MKKLIYLSSVLIFLGLFVASPYILDYLQYKSALEAAGGMSVYEGATSVTATKCRGDCNVNGVDTCCNSDNFTCFGNSIAPACLDYELTVDESAGGQKCDMGYFLTVEQQPMVEGAENVIVAGTICTKLSIVASEKGCLGCTAAINSSKVYAFKNKIKAFLSTFIIAGFND